MNAYYVANANANNTESKRVTLSLLDFIPCQSTSLQKISLLNTCTKHLFNITSDRDVYNELL